MTGISIGKYINHRLSNTPEVTSLIKDKFFPLATLKDLDFPFLSYRRDSLVPSETIDGINGDSVSVDVAIASDKYFQSVEVAEAVRKALEGKRSAEFNISDTRLVSASEEFKENTFVQILTFEFITE